MADKITVKTACKVNLGLDVTGKLENGYHTIESVFQTVGIYDEVTVELTEQGINISCEVPNNFAQSDPIPCDERNIAYKTAKLFLEENNLSNGCNIHIKKGIPSQAGLGGGSTDSAAVIYCLNRLTGKSLANPEKIGADVPFFLTGGTAYVSGIGEIIKPIADYSGKILVVAKGKEGVSTAEAYRKIDSLSNPKHPEIQKLVNSIEENSTNTYNYFGNLFETAINLSEVNKIKEIMLKEGALSALMTGSGSAVFGFFGDYKNPDYSSAEFCCNQLMYAGFYARICKTVSESFIEL